MDEHVLGFAVVSAAVLGTGAGLTRVLYARHEREQPSALELTVAGAVAGSALWLAVNWLLAVTHSLTRPLLLAAAGAFIAAAIVLRPRFLAQPSRAAVLLLLPVGLWLAYVAIRAVFVPPVNHDALSYHLPKAVLFVRETGLPSFAGYDHRFASFPANYELLVADVLILAGSDRVTEWIGVTYAILFLAATALLAKTWWGGGLPVAAAVVATAAAPVFLIHSGADKNDLMTHFFVLAALLWGARWSARGGVVPMTLMILSGALAVGTKTTAGALAIGFFPFLAWRVLRHGLRLRSAVATVAFGIAAFLACGGVTYVEGLRTGARMGVSIGGQDVGNPLFSYSRWTHLWELPLEMFGAGVSFGADSRHILFSSHFGPATTILVILLPFAIWWYGREGAESTRAERTIASAAALLTFVSMLPTDVYPAAMPRYAMFLLPLINAWTIAPAVAAMQRRFTAYAYVAAAVLLAMFTQQAADMAVNDASCPLRYVRRCFENPGTREPPHVHRHASLVADRLAGPSDTIAVAGDASTWIYPLYGAKLTRPVRVIALDGSDRIPAETRWVVVERWWNDGAEMLSPLQNALAHDPRFTLTYEDRRFRQWLYRRVEPNDHHRE